MKILYVTGKNYIVDKAESYGIHQLYSDIVNDELPPEFEDCEVLTFPGNPPSEEFIAWLKDSFCDYDQLKHSNFYVMG